MDEDRLKQILKEALTEMLEEKQNLFHDLVLDAMEDIALSRARNLLERLINYETETLRCMDDKKVPFSNNQGENDIRMIPL